VVVENRGVALGLVVGDDVVCFEGLEILYFEGQITYWGCHFPRLRHASVLQCSLPELEILTRSRHLESLLIRSYLVDFNSIDVTSCLHLKLLGLPYHASMVPPGFDHPVEHIWLYRTFYMHDPRLFERYLGLSKLSQITLELSPYDLKYRRRQIDELRGNALRSLGLSTRPSAPGDTSLVFERGAALKAWSKIRW
jgi:hypothetical protein